MAGWGSSFLADIAGTGPLRLMFAVELFRTHLDEGMGGSYAVFGTHTAAPGLPWLSYEGLTFGSRAVTPVSWRYSGSSWSFTLAVPEGGLPTVADVLKRGTMVRLRAGLPGYDYGAWEIIQSGRIARMTCRGADRVVVEVYDLVTSLRQRVDDLQTQLQLFYQAGGSTTLTSPYTTGDASISVVGTGDFEFPSGGTGILLITPTTGSPFYLTYTGAAGTTISGLSATGQLGTTEVNAGIGDAVTDYVYIKHRPDGMVARILASTGDGTNGTYDDFPKSWGYALPDSVVVDTSDIVLNVGNAVLGAVSGTYEWEFAEGSQQDDGLSWLTTRLSKAGLWICQRQGRLTLRAAQDLRGSPALHTGIEITDEHIISGEVEWYDAQTPIEYGSLSVATASASASTTTTSVSTLPGAEQYDIDLSGLVRTNESNIRTEISDRLLAWLTRPAERIKVRLRSLWWDQLTTGDLVTLTSSRLFGRTLSTVTGYLDRNCMVASVRPSWLGGYVDMELLTQPLDTLDE